jgi:hypothetical protein
LCQRRPRFRRKPRRLRRNGPRAFFPGFRQMYLGDCARRVSSNEPPQTKPTNCPKGSSSIITGTGTFQLGGLGALVGGLFGPDGAVIGYAIGSEFGVGADVSYVPSGNNLYFGPAVAFAPFQIGGGSSLSASLTRVPSDQSANAIANGLSFSASFQANPLLGTVVTKSPGSGPAVTGTQVGTRSPITFGAAYNFHLLGSGGC